MCEVYWEVRGKHLFSFSVLRFAMELILPFVVTTARGTST